MVKNILTIMFRNKHKLKMKTYPKKIQKYQINKIKQYKPKLKLIIFINYLIKMTNDIFILVLLL